MDKTPITPEEKIILAAIDCIEKFGIAGATNRRIALTAGVNSAAINYYFRSKEVLIKRCMEITLKNAFDLSDMPSAEGVTAQQRCVDIMMELIAGGFQYPGITRSHFYNLFAEGHYDSLLIESVNSFIEAMALDLQQRNCPFQIGQIKEALAQVTSVVFLIILAPQLFVHNQDIDFHDPTTCREYLTRLVTHLLS